MRRRSLLGTALLLGGSPLLADAGQASQAPDVPAASRPDAGDNFAERELLRVRRTYKTGLFGFSDDDVHTFIGKPTRHEIYVTKSGPISGGAHVTVLEPGKVVVHRFLDLLSELNYELVIYGE
jgi:hypothetical protein